MAIRPDIAVDRLVADRGKLLAYVWSIVHDFHATEDIYQEVVVAAMSHAAEIEDEGHLLLWARQAARFRAIDWLRRQNRQPVLLDEDVLDLLEGQWKRFDAAPAQAWTDAMRHCVSALTDYSRQLIGLRYVEGLSGLEVAQRVGRAPKTVYVALGRIYRQLEDCIQRRLTLVRREESAHGLADK